MLNFGTALDKTSIFMEGNTGQKLYWIVPYGVVYRSCLLAFLSYPVCCYVLLGDVVSLHCSQLSFIVTRILLHCNLQACSLDAIMSYPIMSCCDGAENSPWLRHWYAAKKRAEAGETQTYFFCRYFTSWSDFR